MGLEFADEAREDDFVDSMENKIEKGNIARHFYDEGPLMVRFELTAQVRREWKFFSARNELTLELATADPGGGIGRFGGQVSHLAKVELHQLRDSVDPEQVRDLVSCLIN